jgi:hypothetical protein
MDPWWERIPRGNLKAKGKVKGNFKERTSCKSKRNLPHVTYPHPKGMGHYGHIKTGKFRKKLTAFDASIPAASSGALWHDLVN